MLSVKANLRGYRLYDSMYIAFLNAQMIVNRLVGTRGLGEQYKGSCGDGDVQCDCGGRYTNLPMR